MSKSFYVASAEGHTAKSVVALGAIESLTKKFPRVSVFRAVSTDPKQHDPILELLHEMAGSKIPIDECVGVGYQDVHESSEAAIAKVLERFKKVEEQSDVVLVLGSDYTDVFSPAEFQFNARLATNLGTPMVLVFNGRELYTASESIGQAKARSASDLASVAELVIQEVRLANTELLAVVVNRADNDRTEEIQQAIGQIVGGETPVWAIPEDRNLLAPRMSQLMEAVDGQLLYGKPDALKAEVLALVVASMTNEHVLERISEGAVVVVPADRTDVLLGLIMADQSSTFPALAGVVLNGGFKIPDPIHRLIVGLDSKLPVVATGGNSFETTLKVTATRGLVRAEDQDKVNRAKTLAARSIDYPALLVRLESHRTNTVTPLMFQHQLMVRAKENIKTIVLPEGSDDRILQAASEVLHKGIAKLIILGDPETISSRAASLKLDLSAAELMSIEGSKHFDTCVNEYVKLRAHKGVTPEQARETMKDGSYFGTMLVQLGIADGMVSGAAHTTANTIRPAFEFVKTKPGVSVVSSVFLMALADRVVVYGDCAVIPEPTAEQLADIAISSAATAKNFGIDPKVALLSYSTGTSGTGADVDKVRAATELVHKRAPELSVDGPIQFDAAVDVAVAKAKLPESDVAGKATVFVFPDLNTGNNTYKAVQRTAGAVAIGPVLQGLKKPVNDLSRGALVEDIVNTIALTAIQAAQE